MYGYAEDVQRGPVRNHVPIGLEAGSRGARTPSHTRALGEDGVLWQPCARIEPAEFDIA